MRISVYDSSIDIAEPRTDIEVEVSPTGQVMWVNVEGKCVLRICKIGGHKVTFKEGVIRRNDNERIWP